MAASSSESKVNGGVKGGKTPFQNTVKYVLVTGGVMSGLGKGVIASSTGRLLRSHGLRVTAIKIDPYINIDAGTMSPFEHGEVFVLDDGGEADLDLGNYERFLDIKLTRDNNITTGKIYDRVIQKERKGEYLGKTVQVVPHISDEIQDWVLKVAHTPTDGLPGAPDVCVIELGGTVGDIESMPFIEAMRQFQFKVGRGNMCIMHVSLVPVIGAVGEQKTKPTQQSARDLRALGLIPDLIMCRSSDVLSQETQDKISSFCHVEPRCVIGVNDVSNIYRVPRLLFSQNILGILTERLSLKNVLSDPTDFDKWCSIADTVDALKSSSSVQKDIHIAMVGKYTDLADSYLSVVRSLQHASYYVGNQVKIDWVEATDLEDPQNEKHSASWALLKSANGILVPGGFGDRGVEGKILAAKFARESKIPYFGICLGMQVAVIEAARHVLGWKDANSGEFSETTQHPVIVFMPEISRTHMGGTMRLGKRRTFFTSTDSLAARLYKPFHEPLQREAGELAANEEFKFVDERHRHRFEVNPKLVSELQATGLSFVGQDETGERQEIIEIQDHPFYLAVQYHPEFLSRPNRPSPPFVGLLLAASGKLNAWLEAHP
jgi:CTP synthase